MSALMKVSCLQMKMELGNPSENFLHAKQMIRRAVKEHPDVLVLPETWNTGFFPKTGLAELSSHDLAEVKEHIGGLAMEYNVNIVAGSVSNLRGGKIFNTAAVFDRKGACIAEYDKTHLFTPMGEDGFYTRGDHLCVFSLDGIKCGVIICYDLRFPELTRRLSLDGIGMLFVVSQWPEERIAHLRCLTAARAIENQIFVVNCNSCSSADGTVYGGTSAVIDPLGRTLALAGKKEEILSAECHTNLTEKIRDSIPVFRDRHPGLYET